MRDPLAPRLSWPGRLALLLALAALSIGLSACVDAVRASAGAAGAPSFNGGVLSPARALPELSLQRADGRRFSSADTRGRISLFFFGYTFCPDVCPLTLAQIKRLRELLGPSAAGVDAYFVTVDPARDTPERLAAYLRQFDPSIIGLTGTDEELAHARAFFGVVAEQRPAPNSQAGYFMDHTATIFLVDQEGRLRLVYPYGMTPEQLSADIQRLSQP